MSIIKTIITCMCAMLAMIDPAQDKGWRGIVPLHSTRADVERLLGSPREARGVAATHNTENEKVLIFYSADPCKRGVSEWNVPRDTVVSITVYPKAKLLVADLQLDKTKYKKVRDPHLEGITYYVNKEEGIRLDARPLEGGEDVNSITYEPAAKDKYLRCPGAPATSDGDENGSPPRKFDEYSNISFNDEKARLDNFAIYLQKDEPEFKSYIIVYAGPKTRSGQAQARAKRAKDYLVKVRGINAKRIVTIDGGYREHLETELYALPPKMSAPVPSPSEVQIIRAARRGVIEEQLDQGTRTTIQTKSMCYRPREFRRILLPPRNTLFHTPLYQTWSEPTTDRAQVRG